MFGRHPSFQLRLVTVGTWKRKRRGARIGLIGTLTVAMIVAAVYVAFASHQFSDVPNSAFYHNAVEWISNRGITAGCATGLYCPDNNVTRGQMAVFLRALGVALTPQLVRGASGYSPVDPDAGTTICVTSVPPYSPPFPQRILARGWLSLLSGGPMSTFIKLVYSTNGGVSWTDMEGAYNWPLAGHGSAGFWYQTTSFAYHDLSPGNNYLFGIAVGRASGGGTADATSHFCEFLGEVVNRNPGTPPLSPSR